MNELHARQSGQATNLTGIVDCLASKSDIHTLVSRITYQGYILLDHLTLHLDSLITGKDILVMKPIELVLFLLY